jgi:hypothetical protein
MVVLRSCIEEGFQEAGRTLEKNDSSPERYKASCQSQLEESARYNLLLRTAIS